MQRPASAASAASASASHAAGGATEASAGVSWLEAALEAELLELSDAYQRAVWARLNSAAGSVGDGDLLLKMEAKAEQLNALRAAAAALLVS